MSDLPEADGVEAAPKADAPREGGAAPRREKRLRDVARRVIREFAGEEEDTPRPEASSGGEGAGTEPRAERPDRPEKEDRRAEARALLGALLDTGDKAKTEIVRLVAREVRSYLEAMELHKDLNHLLTHYRLDVHISLGLEPKTTEAAKTGVALRPKDPPPAD